MPYIVTLGETTYQSEPGPSSHERTITLDGTTYVIDWQQIAPLANAASHTRQPSAGGRYSLLINGRSYEVFARRLTTSEDEQGQHYEIQIGGQRFEVQVEDEREKILTSAVQGKHHSDVAQIRAPMPGLVLDLPFEPGAEVTRGQTVVVLEAMKMENDLASPITGTLKELRVSKGQTVNQGDILVIISST